jgi:hypothetical protein
VVTVYTVFLAQHGLLKMNTGSYPCLRAPEPFVHHSSLGLTLMPRRQNRLVPQYALEGGEVSGGVAERVLCNLGPGLGRPLPRPVLTIRPQKPAHILVYSLHLPITLGVKLRLIETPRCSMNGFQTLDVSWGPRSDTISSGTPYCRKTCVKKASAVCRAVGRPGRGRRRQDLEDRSTTTTIAVLPCEGEIGKEIHRQVRPQPLWNG